MLGLTVDGRHQHGSIVQLLRDGRSLRLCPSRQYWWRHYNRSGALLAQTLGLPFWPAEEGKRSIFERSPSGHFSIRHQR